MPPAHLSRVTADGIDARSAATGRRTTSSRCGFASDQAYADGLRDMSRSRGAPADAQRPLRSAATSAAGSIRRRWRRSPHARSREKNQRLAAFTQVPRAGFDGPVPPGHYADETPYVEAIRKLAGNIDVTYVRNDECDDFADLERFFLALEGPVRNPTNLGWMLAIPRLARTQGRRVLLGGLLRQLHHQLERLVADRRPPARGRGCSPPIANGGCTIAARPIRAGRRCASSSSSR